jgi:dihydroorotase
MWKRIDPHVHCRDWNEAYKSTIRDVMDLARSQGVVAVLDMPNTDPPILGPEEVEARLRTAKERAVHSGYYVYVAATPDARQLGRALAAAENNDRVAGLKMYSAPMKGLEVSGLEEQHRVYRRLSESGYEGVIAVHCEKAQLLRLELWNPERPWSWGDARPPQAEVESIRDQIRLVEITDFRGTLYVVHTSTPEGVRLVNEAKERGLRVVCGVTPHHLMLSLEDMARPGGVFFKVNPPLRDKRLVGNLVGLVVQGLVDFLETDHAPHAPWEKYGPPYMSGIRSLELYSRCVDFLLSQGASERLLREMTYHRVKRVFPMVKE